MKKYLTFVLVLIISSKIQSQEWLNFTSTSRIMSSFVKNDKLYLSTQGGLVTIDANTNQLNFQNRSNSNLPVNIIFEYLIDINGNSWYSNYLIGLTKSDGNNWINYNTENSEIPSNHFRGLTSDNDGNIWLAHSQIPLISKFDGTNWESFDISSLSNSQISVNNMISDDFGNIWFFGSAIGLVKFDGNNFTQYTQQNSDLPSNNISNIEFDSTGKLWISTFNSGLVMLENNQFTTFDETNTTLESNIINSFKIVGNSIWGICSQEKNSFFRFDGANFETIQNLNDEFQIDRIEGITATSNSKLWFWNSKSKGSDLFSYDINTEELNLINHNQTALVGNIIPSIDISDNGVVWIADANFSYGYGGLVSFSNPTWSSYANGQQVRWVKSINDSLVWFNGTSGLVKKINNSFEYFSPNNSPLESYYIHNLEYDKINDISWYTTDSSLHRLSQGDWQVYNPTNFNLPTGLNLNDFELDTLNNLWFVSDHSDILFNLSGQNLEIIDTINLPFPFYQFKSIDIDRVGNIWFSTYDNGLFKLQDSIFFNFIPDVQGENNGHIIAFGFDNYNDLWVSTAYGVSYYKNENWNLFNTENSSIANNYILCFAFDVYDNVWMGTNAGGISIYNEDEVFLNINLLDHDFVNEISVFPNPFNDFIKLKSNLNIEGAKLQLYDLLGNKHLEKIIDFKGQEILTNHLSDGLYIYKISHKNKILRTGLINKN